MNTAITTPTLDLSAILRAGIQPSTRARYLREIELLQGAGVDPTDRDELIEYSDTLPSSRKAFLSGALSLMTKGMEEALKAQATPDNLPIIQASIYRLQAMRGVIKTAQPKGSLTPTRLSQKQVADITSLCNGETLEQRRDWIVLGLLLAAGLRREELSNLQFSDIRVVPTPDGQPRTVADVRHGKGDHKRTVPINAKLTERLKEWRAIAGDGYIARSLGMSKRLGERMSAASIGEIVGKYGKRIGIDNLRAHDCRRTYATLAYNAGSPLLQISRTLGHASIETTQIYLSLEIDLTSAPSDFVPLA